MKIPKNLQLFFPYKLQQKESEQGGATGGCQRGTWLRFVGVAEIRSETHQGIAISEKLLQVQQFKRVFSKKTSGKEPFGSGNFHCNLHFRAQSHPSNSPELPRRQQAYQVPGARKGRQLFSDNPFDGGSSH
jgi:hypothetical protein